jgi:hypothetical protein
MKPTVSGIFRLDEPPRPHHTQEEALDATESTYANLWGYAHPTQSTSPRTGVNKMLTRFVPGNHDWYDSLDGFGRLFRLRVRMVAAGGDHRRPDRQGPLILQGHVPVQDASYFALRLPWH